MRYLESGLAPLVPMGHRLVAVDLRGRGAASQVTDTAQIGLAHDVEDLERLRVELKLEKLKLVGDHWGGTIAAMYAARYPSRVERVVMLAPAMPRLAWSYQLANYAYDPAYLKRYLAAAGAHADSLDPIGFCRAYWPFYLAPAITFDTIVTAKGRDAVCSVPPDQLRRIVPLALRIANSIGIADQRDAVKGITAPVLVLAGFRNQVYAAMYAEWLQALPTARADSVAAAAMFPWLVDPSRTYTDIDAFVRGRWPAGAH